MKVYRVRGEYGIQQGAYVEKEYQAKTPDSARNKFIRELKKNDPKLWSRIGRGNTYVEEVRDDKTS